MLYIKSLRYYKYYKLITYIYYLCHLIKNIAQSPISKIIKKFNRKYVYIATASCRQNGRASSVLRNQQTTSIIPSLATHFEKKNSKVSLQSNTRINFELQSKIPTRESHLIFNSKKLKGILPSEPLKNAREITKEKYLSDYANLSEISTSANTIGSRKQSWANRLGDLHKGNPISIQFPDSTYSGLSRKGGLAVGIKKANPEPKSKKTFGKLLNIPSKPSIKRYEFKKEVAIEFGFLAVAKKPRSRNTSQLSNYRSGAIVLTKQEEGKSASRRALFQFNQAQIRNNYKSFILKQEDPQPLKESSIVPEPKDESDRSDSCQTVIEKNCDNDYSLITDSLNEKY